MALYRDSILGISFASSLEIEKYGTESCQVQFIIKMQHYVY